MNSVRLGLIRSGAEIALSAEGHILARLGCSVTSEARFFSSSASLRPFLCVRFAWRAGTFIRIFSSLLFSLLVLVGSRLSILPPTYNTLTFSLFVSQSSPIRLLA